MPTTGAELATKVVTLLMHLVATIPALCFAADLRAADVTKWHISMPSSAVTRMRIVKNKNIIHNHSPCIGMMCCSGLERARTSDLTDVNRAL